MTLEELHQSVWNDLPATKRVAGRWRVSRIIDRALKKWPVAVLRQCDQKESDVVGVHLARTIQAEEKQVGMGFITAIILSTLISEIIKQLMKKWWANRDEMTELCR